MRANTLMKITNFARRQVWAKWPSNPTKPITWPDCRNKTPPLSSRAKKIKRSLAHEKKHYWKRNLIISFNIFLPFSAIGDSPKNHFNSLFRRAQRSESPT
ncbi:hypothetical protein CDAR_383101 [Caerostris darwini]|uniref:Uncharacterized protein n=1 Tax=Caerostris darwini TaxID=1538125 RepID=A0AAV4NVB5_9ARAC|nr:hypothetical protein CDAR_383101 [Caerostris darwini]